ncbi:MAG: PAS domain-containing protein, partial [Chthoniobacterales bacterium]
MLTTAIGVAVLVGWACNYSPLKTVLPGLVSMKANAAIAFCFAGLSLFLFTISESGPNKGTRRLSTLCALVAGSIGLLTLIEYGTGISLGIDELFFRDLARSVSVHHPAGRSSPITAFNFVCLGTALALLRFPRGWGWAHALTGAAAFTSLLAIIGYCYGVEALYESGNSTAVALHTAIAFLILVTGLWCGTSDYGFMRVVAAPGKAGTLVRRFGLAALALPFLFEIVEIHGDRHGWFGPELGSALHAMISIVSFAILIWVGASSLHSAERKEEAVRENLLQAHNSLERRVAERTSELRLSNDTLQMQARVLASMTESVMVADEHGFIVSANPATETMFGYKQGELVGQHVSVLHDLEEAESPRVTAKTMASVKEGSSWEGEINRRRKDGTPFVSRSQINAFEVAGKLHFFAVHADITEQKQAGLEQRRSAEMQASILNALPAEVVLLSKDGTIVTVNENWRRFAAANLLLTPDFGVGSNYFEICRLAAGPDAEEAGAAAIGLRQVIDGALPEFSLEYPCHSPTQQRWFRMVAAPLQKGAEGIVVMHLDITARKIAEDKYRSIFDNASEGIFQNTPEGVMISANPALAHMFGFDGPEEMIRERNNIQQQAYAEPEKRKEFRLRLEAAGVLSNVELEMKRKDGSAISVSENIRVVRDAAGGVLYYEGTMQDITERKRAEETLRDSEEKFRLLADN